jgi:hypothetical protein
MPKPRPPRDRLWTLGRPDFDIANSPSYNNTYRSKDYNNSHQTTRKLNATGKPTQKGDIRNVGHSRKSKPRSIPILGTGDSSSTAQRERDSDRITYVLVSYDLAFAIAITIVST